MAYIGIDLHTDSFVACYLSSQNEETKTFKLNPQSIEEFKNTITKRDKLAVEATGNTSFFVDQIKGKVKEIVVVSPRHFFVISKSNKKTDKSDAKALAYYLSKKLLPKARIRSHKSQQLSSLINTRFKFIKIKSMLIVRAHSILVTHGLKVGRSLLGTKSGFKKYILIQEWEGPVEAEIKVIGDSLASTLETIALLDKEIEDLAKTFYGYENLLSISGIGPLSAAVFLSVIDDINDFSHPKKLASYFGIVPRVRESNNIRMGSRITKSGSKIGRTTLIQCTWVVIRHSEFFRNFYESVKKQGSGKKAIVACARKFLWLIYETLRNNWIFEDFPNYQYRVPKVIQGAMK